MSETNTKPTQANPEAAIHTLPVLALEPNGYNFNEMTGPQFDALVEEIRERGYVFHPVVVEEIVVGERFRIVDGEHQWKAAKAAGLVAVPVQVIGQTRPLNLAEQAGETYKRNELRGSANRVKLGRAIRTAQAEAAEKGTKLSNKAMARLFGMTDVWVAAQLGYAELADLAGSRPDLPATADEVATLTEKQVRDLLSLARSGAAAGAGDEEGDEGQERASSAKGGPGDEPEDKAAHKLAKLKIAVKKLAAEDRAEIRKALDEAEREERARAKARKDAATAEAKKGTDAVRAQFKAEADERRAAAKAAKQTKAPHAAPLGGQEGQA